jgi:hypothetical protein
LRRLLSIEVITSTLSVRSDAHSSNLWGANS